MGVDREDYFMVGIDINDLDIDFHSLENEDKYGPYLNLRWIDDKSEFCIINDGMSGEYSFFGKVLDQGNYHEGLDINIVEDYDMNKIKEKVLIEANNLFNRDFSKDDVKIICFTHWH
jgi:hypothetical protein